MRKRKRNYNTASAILVILLTFLPSTLAAYRSENTYYEVQLEGLFPERADLHLEHPNKHEVINLEDSIRRDHATFQVVY